MTTTDWQPGPDVTAMGGKPLPSGRVYPIEPPVEVGRVVKATSDLVAGRPLPPLWAKLAADALLAAVAVPIVWWGVHRLPPGGKPGLVEILLTLGPVVVVIVAVANSFRLKWVGYVGTTGAAAYSTRGGAADLTGQHVRFADVADVQIDQRQHRATGRNRAAARHWVEWEARFIDGAGTVRMRLRGNVRRVGSGLVPSTVYAIAAAAHKAWEQQRPAADEPTD